MTAKPSNIVGGLKLPLFARSGPCTQFSIAWLPLGAESAAAATPTLPFPTASNSRVGLTKGAAIIAQENTSTNKTFQFTNIAWPSVAQCPGPQVCRKRRVRHVELSGITQSEVLY